MLVIVKPTLVKELTKKKKEERKMNVRILSFRFFVIFRSVTSDTWPSTRITNFTAHKSEIFFSFRSFKDKNSWGYIHSLLRLYERSFHQHSPFKRILKFFFHATISRPYNTIQIVLILKKQRTYLQEIHNGFKLRSTDASNVFESLTM